MKPTTASHERALATLQATLFLTTLLLALAGPLDRAEAKTTDGFAYGDLYVAAEGASPDPGRVISGGTDNDANTAGYSYSFEGKLLINSKVNFHPDMFFTDARELSGDVAKFCVGLAAAAYDDGAGELTRVYDTFGFDWRAFNYARQGTYGDCDFVAYSIAHKAIRHDGRTYNLWVVPVRGTTANSEWFSNFHLGDRDDGYHEGFRKAADEVLADIRSLITTDDNIIVLAGHSRGAAVANIVAGELTKSGELAGADRIFAYTFACPSVGLNADESLSNIRNYNIIGDGISELPLSEWGYKRYGQTLELNPDQATRQNFLQRFKAVMGRDYAGAANADAFVNVMKAFAATKEDFGSDDNKLRFDLIAWMLGGKNDVELSEILQAHSKSGVGDLTTEAADELESVIGSGSLSDMESRIGSLQAEADGSGGIGLAYMEGLVRLIRLFSATDGDPMGAVTDGHLPVTYILSINSMFYGYEGWANSTLTIDYAMADGNKILGESCFEGATNLRSVTIADDYLLVGRHAFRCDHVIESVTIPCDWTPEPDMGLDECGAKVQRIHKWDAGAVTTPATYAATGVRAFTCARCGQVSTEVIPALARTSLADAKIASVSSKTYTGKAIKPVPAIEIAGKTLKKGVDFTLSYAGNKNAGKATITITGKGAYMGTRTVTFKIVKAENPLSVKAAAKTVSASKVKSKAQVVTGALKVTRAQGKVTYSKVGGSAKLSINKGTGKIAVKKGTKKGTYSIKVKALAAGGKNYKSGSKTIVVKVAVKQAALSAK